jgi:hypothetical protein
MHNRSTATRNLAVLVGALALVGCASQVLTPDSTEKYAISHGLKRVTKDGREQYCPAPVPAGFDRPLEKCISWQQLRNAQFMRVYSAAIGPSCAGADCDRWTVPAIW